MSFLSSLARHSAQLSLLIFIGLGLALLPESAHAVVAGDFYCAGGHAYGQLYDTGNGVCPATMKFTNIFSFLICHTEQLSANLMGSMYCGIVAKLAPAVTAMVTLAVLFFGVSFTMGFTQITAKEFQAILLKIAVVVGFATQSDLLIGIGYNILVTGLREGTAIAVSSLYTSTGTVPANGLGVYGLLDGFLAQALHFATDAVGQAWENGKEPCKNAIFAVMAVMAFVLPPIFYMCVLLMIRIALTFVRSVFGYLYSLLGIVFLLSLAPIFLSFYLFKVTQPFFEKWLKYLISFSLQMVIVFAFLSFVVSIKVDSITNSLTTIIIPVAETQESTTIRAPWKYCTLCEFDVVDKTDHSTVLSQKADFLASGELKCRQPIKPISIWTAQSPDATSSEQAALLKFATHGLLALVVLAYIVDALLGMIPELARGLSSSFDVTAPGIPGGGMLNTVERSFQESFEKAVERSFQESFEKAPNTISGVADGFKSATKNLVVGGRFENGEEAPGIAGSFKNFLLDPQGRD